MSTSLGFTFIFLCVSVGRMVKYTGYGNAAGMLASRGLMAGGRGQVEGEYSSESDESDTEVYETLKEA